MNNKIPFCIFMLHNCGLTSWVSKYRDRWNKRKILIQKAAKSYSSGHGVTIIRMNISFSYFISKNSLKNTRPTEKF